jgi:hypothetical protein
VAYMKLHGFLTLTGELTWSNHPAWPLQIDLVALRYAVENPICAFLYRRPWHPFAWSLLAWAYVQRQAWEQAAEACLSLLGVVEQVLSRSGLPGRGQEGEGEEERYYVENITRLVTVAMRGLELCGRMIRAPSSSSSSSSPPSLPAVQSVDYPFIEQVVPQFTTATVALLPTLTKENVIMQAFEECLFDKCCSLLLTRQAEILGSVQAADVANISRLRHWVRWMQMLDYFVKNSSESNIMEKFFACLVPVGRLLSSARNEGTELSELQQCCYVLNAFRMHPEGFLQVGQACLRVAGEQDVAVAVLDLGLSLHPRNDAILRMLGRADPSQLQSAAMASLSVSRAMLTCSCTDEDLHPPEVSLALSKKEALCCQLVCMPASFSPPGLVTEQEQGQEQESAALTPLQTPAPLSLLHMIGRGRCECVCPQRRATRGEEVIPAYCDSVALHCAHTLQAGNRCSQRDRKDLLTALWMDPANTTTWAALAGSIFSDIALGPKSRDDSGAGEEEEKGEQGGGAGKDDPSAEATGEGKAAAQEVGVFADRAFLPICLDIVLFLHRSSSPTGTGNALNTQVVDLSLVCDWGTFCSSDKTDAANNLAEYENGAMAALVGVSGSNGESAEALEAVFKLVSSARSECFMGNYLESIPLFEQVIRQLTISSLPKQILVKILIELGNVYSFLLLPEKACEQYKLSETIALSQNGSEASLAPLTSLFCAVAFSRKASASSDHKDMTMAREYADEACAGGGGAASLAASAYLVKALIWLGLSKPKKVKEEVLEAKALLSSVDVPF